jgi:putative lipoprotein
MASDEPAIMEPAVNGTILLPEGTTLAGATEWSIEVQDTSLLDAPAVVIGADAGRVTDETATEILFAAGFDPAGIDERNTYTLSARIVDVDGNLMFTNDTSIQVITNGAPIDDVEVPVIEVTAAFSPMASEVPSE